MIKLVSIRGPWNQVIWLSCVLGAFTASGVGQQISAQVNVGVHAAVTSSHPSFQVFSNPGGSHPGKIAGTGIEQAFAPATNFGGSPAFASAGSPSVVNSTLADNVSHQEHSPALGAAPHSLPGKPAAAQSSTSVSSVSAPHVGQLIGNGVVVGQFPDSTREVVLPSPLLSGNSLQFFRVAEPHFSPSFESKRHLSPSYNVAPIRPSYRWKRNRSAAAYASWLRSLQNGSNQTLGSQSQPAGMANPLNKDTLLDPLKSQSSSLPAANQPN